tara:strand:+ start:72 stop:539 length:468 start_codon:yes stop_codon:yes gene_type:complete
MATTTATCTLSSTDMHSQAISLSSTSTLYKHDTISTGLEQLSYHRLVLTTTNTPTGSAATQFDLITEDARMNANPANYVYIINKNTAVDDYVKISINDEIIGSLYGGDWMFIPWSCALTAAANDSTIEAQAFTSDCVVEYALFHSGELLVTAADA